jgi:carbon-monoxide dehydrogenase iron sulfur subunit
MRRVYVDEELCMGCGLCRVYCEAHQTGEDDLVKAFKRRTSPPAGGIRVERLGTRAISVRCHHCDDAPCVEACLTGALYRDADSGLVLLDRERCIGCGTCTLVCPFGAITRDGQTGTMVKCDGCLDRDIPRCVGVCPNGALVLKDEETADSVVGSPEREPVLV